MTEVNSIKVDAAPITNVILVNNSDPDVDCLPGFADGFDFLGEHNLLDDSDNNGVFQEWIVTFGGSQLDINNAAVSFTYASSDPRALNIDFSGNWQIPDGAFRIWSRNSAQRSRKSISEGGHYVESGTNYSLSELGITQNQKRLTLYIEAISPSQSENDRSIQTTLTQGEISVNKTTSFTTVQFDLIGKIIGNDLGDFRMDSGLLSSTNNDTDFFAGPVVEYYIKITDPRNISTASIAGRNLTLTPQAGCYQSETFHLIEQARSVFPAEIVIPDEHIKLDWQYNPDGEKLLKKFPVLNRWDDELVKLVIEEVEAMVRIEWEPGNPSDSGAFGKEVHRRVVNRLRGKSGWMINVVVENDTNRILKIDGVGDRLPQQGYTQVDILRTEKGILGGYYSPNVGDVIDHNRLEDLYDIKTTMSGGFTPNQKDRLKSVLNGWGNPQNRKIKTVKPHKRWKPRVDRFVDNPYFKKGIRFLQSLAQPLRPGPYWIWMGNRKPNFRLS